MKQCIDGLRRVGYCVMRNVIPPQEVSALRESISAAVREHTTTALPQGYLGGLLRVNQDIAHHIAHPRILSLCEELFGSHTRISAITGSVNGPGVLRGGLHVDWPHNTYDESCVRGQLRDVLVHLVTLWMLTDFTAENGATIVVPESHRWPSDGLDRSGVISSIEQRLLGNAGDVALLDARTWHAIGPNLSQEERVAVIVRYAPWWLNLNPLHRGTRDRQLIVENRSGRDPYVAPLPLTKFHELPANVQPLVYSMVESNFIGRSSESVT